VKFAFARLMYLKTVSGAVCFSRVRNHENEARFGGIAIRYETTHTATANRI